MVDNVRRECIMSMYEIYPLSRKLVFDTFDKNAVTMYRGNAHNVTACKQDKHF